MKTSRDPRGVWAALFGGLFLFGTRSPGRAAAAGPQCVDFSKDPAGCQPSTFKTPMAQMPTVRVNRQGVVDPTSSEEDARAGAAKLEKDLHLFRNFEQLHWVLTVPSVKDPATGAWKGGDLDGAGDARGLGIGGNCIFVGHGNGAGVRHAINIFKLQPNPEKQPPVQVGEIPGEFRRQSGVRRPRASVARLQDVEGRRPLHHGEERGHRHDRPNGDLPHRHEHVPADVEDRDHGLPFAVARILPLARPGEHESRAGPHGHLDRGPAGPRSSRPEDPRRNRAGRDRREDGRGAAAGQGARRVQLAGSGRAARQREARRDGPVLRRPLPGFQRLEEPLGPRRELPEQRAEPVSFHVGLRGWRADLCRRHDGRLLRARHRSDCASHRRRAGRRHGWLQSALDDRRRPTACSIRPSCPRSPTTAFTWS